MLIALAFSFQSCLHDDNDTFDESAAERLDKAATADKACLESATNGWVMHYYTGEEYSGGGFTFLVKFKDNKAYVSSEIAPEDMVTTSSYDVIKDQGPVLTFNTYNLIMHYFAQPAQEDVDGVQGDYEFVIQKATADSVFLKGKKWGNHMLLTKMPEATEWTAYLKSLSDMNESIEFATYKACAGSDSIGKMTFDFDNRRVTCATGGNVVSCPYYVTSTGIALQQAVSLGGKTVQNFSYDAGTTTFTCTDAGAEGIKLTVLLPKNYMHYNEFAGSYSLLYNNKTINVKLAPASDGASYVMTGLNANIKPVLKYNKMNGTLDLCTQSVGTDGSNLVYLCAWSLADGGYFTWSTDAGMTLSRDLSKEGTVLSFANNGGYNLNIDSFILILFSGEPSNDTYIGVEKNKSWFVNGDYRLPYMKTLTKIQ